MTGWVYHKYTNKLIHWVYKWKEKANYILIKPIEILLKLFMSRCDDYSKSKNIFEMFSSENSSNEEIKDINVSEKKESCNMRTALLANGVDKNERVVQVILEFLLSKVDVNLVRNSILHF